MPGVPAGMISEALSASVDIKATLGRFDPSLGERSNEVTGVAIHERKQQGDLSSFHFIDNLGRGIEFLGRQMLDLIPRVYTPGRIARVIGEDGEPSSVQLGDLQGQAPEMGEDEKPTIYDLTAGKYDLVVDVGPSYGTRRQEASSQMMDLLKSFPEAAPLIGDLVAKNLDWPGAEEIAERLRYIVPVPTSPEQSRMVEELNDQIGMLQQMLQVLTTEDQRSAAKTAIDAYNAQTKRFDSETKRLDMEATHATDVQDIPIEGSAPVVPFQLP